MRCVTASEHYQGQQKIEKKSNGRCLMEGTASLRRPTLHFCFKQEIHLDVQVLLTSKEQSHRYIVFNSHPNHTTYTKRGNHRIETERNDPSSASKCLNQSLYFQCCTHGVPCFGTALMLSLCLIVVIYCSLYQLL